MAIKVGDLVKKLQQTDQEKEVEFVIVATDGSLVGMDIETQACELITLLEMFGCAE